MPDDYNAPAIDKDGLKKILKEVGQGGKSKFGSSDGFKFIALVTVLLFLFLTNEGSNEVIILDSYSDLTDNTFTDYLCYFQPMYSGVTKFFNMSAYYAVMMQKSIMALTLLNLILIAKDAGKNDHIDDFSTFIVTNQESLEQYSHGISEVKKFLWYDLFAKVVCNLIFPALVSCAILLLYLDSSWQVNVVPFPKFFRCFIDQPHLSTRKIEERIRIGKFETLEGFKDLTNVSNNGQLIELNQDQKLAMTVYVKNYARRNHLLFLCLVISLIICCITLCRVVDFVYKFIKISPHLKKT